MAVGDNHSCKRCLRPFTKRAGRYPKYCSTKCRVRAYRDKHWRPDKGRSPIV